MGMVLYLYNIKKLKKIMKRSKKIKNNREKI